MLNGYGPHHGLVVADRRAAAPTLALDFRNGWPAALGTQPSLGSNRWRFNGAGQLVASPHNLLENANLTDVTSGVASGWFNLNTEGSKTYEDQGGYNKLTIVSDNQRGGLANVITTTIGDVYTFGVYVHSVNITSGDEKVFTVSGISAADMFQSEFTGEGFYSVSFVATATSHQLRLYGEVGSTGTCVFSRPFAITGFPAGVTATISTHMLARPPLGRWVGTDDGDEPRYEAMPDRDGYYFHTGGGFTNEGILPEGGGANVYTDSRHATTATNWAFAGTASATPDSVTNANNVPNRACAVSVGDTSANNARGVALSGLTTDARYEPTILMKQDSTTGILRMDNNAGPGEWDIDMSKLHTGWNIIHRDHPATTVTEEFSASATGTLRPRFYGAGSAINFEIDHLTIVEGEIPYFPIPTDGVTASIAADVNETPNVSFLDAALTRQGTLYCSYYDWWVASVAGADQWCVRIDDGGNSDRVGILNDVSLDRVQIHTTNSAGDNGVSLVATLATGAHKVAGSYQEDLVDFSKNGVAGLPDSTADLPLADPITHLRVGHRNGGNEHLHQFIGEVRYYAAPMTAAELDALTA